MANLVTAILGLFKPRESTPTTTVETIVQEVDPGNSQGPREGEIKKPTSVVRRVGLAYGGTPSRNTRVFKESEYNLDEVAAALDTEGYFRRAKDKYIEQIWRNGYSVVGKDPKAVAYIKRRLNQIAQVTNIPTRQLLEDISQQLVPYFNCIITKVRNNQKSGGFPRRDISGRMLQPVAGYFVQDVTSIKVSKEDNGEVIAYKQEIPGVARRPEWLPEDVIHIYMSRKMGLTFGTPMVVPVLDDIRALRRMEENIEILVFQHAVPLYQYKIGTDEIPANDDDIQNAKATVNEMPTNGMLVTPHTHDITAIGAEGRAIRAEGYLNYFKTRIFGELGMSSVSFGEGSTANRGTAITIDRNVQDTSKKFQQIIKLFFDEFIIKELLLEGGFDWDVTEFDYLVELFIPEIDIDSKVKHENHLLEQWQGNAITTEELRRGIGRENFTEQEWQDTYWERIGKIKALIQAIDEPYVSRQGVASGAPTKPGEGKSKGGMERTPASPGVSNRDQPANQYGQKYSPSQRVNASLKTTPSALLDMELDDQISEQSINLLNSLNLRDFNRKLLSNYGILRVDTVNFLKNQYLLKNKDLKKIDRSLLQLYFDLTEEKFDRDSLYFLRDAYNIGVLGALADLGSPSDAQLGTDGREITEYAAKYSKKFIDNLYSRLISLIRSIESQSDIPLEVNSIFDVMEYRVRFYGRTHLIRAHNIGYARLMKTNGVENLPLYSECEDYMCLTHPQVIDLTGDIVPYDRIPPFHGNCVCRPKFIRGE